MVISSSLNMAESKKCDYLVVDSVGFIKNVDLRQMANHVVTLQDVVNEIRDKATRQRLQVLPYELEMKQPGQDEVTHVTNFSKKTGDFGCLSATDIKVMAMALTLEKQVVGSMDHLNKEPNCQRTNVNFYGKKIENGDSTATKEGSDTHMVGFYRPDTDEEDSESENEEEVEQDLISSDNMNFSSFNYWRDPIPEVDFNLPTISPDKKEKPLLTSDVLDSYFVHRSYVLGYTISRADFEVMRHIIGNSDFDQFCHLNRWINHIKSFNDDHGILPNASRASELSDLISHLVKEQSDCVVENLEGQAKTLAIIDSDVTDNASDKEDDKKESEPEADSEEEVEDSDGGGWITPSNVKQKVKQMNSTNMKEEQKHVQVACLTTDFAMQNVLIQMGLNVFSLDGLLIKEQKTWLLRCYACFHVTSLMEKKFCPKCGNKTLKRVSCTLNADGTKQIHISTRKQLSKRGKKFPLPTPRGGKHAINPILTADQNLPQQRITRLARTKTDALSEDYIAGESPFAIHDVTSRSAVLGVPGKGAKANLYWMAKNPNATGRRTGNRKKKPRV